MLQDTCDVKSQFYNKTDGRYSWERITKENVKLMHLFTQLFRPDLYFTLSVFSIRVLGWTVFLFLLKTAKTHTLRSVLTGIIEKLLIDI